MQFREAGSDVAWRIAGNSISQFTAAGKPVSANTFSFGKISCISTFSQSFKTRQEKTGKDGGMGNLLIFFDDNSEITIRLAKSCNIRLAH